MESNECIARTGRERESERPREKENERERRETEYDTKIVIFGINLRKIFIVCFFFSFFISSRSHSSPYTINQIQLIFPL